MKFSIPAALLFLLLAVPFAHAGDTDYLSVLAEHSEIKAIGEVVVVKRVSSNGDGTFKQVTFRRIFALTPYVPDQFVGGCKTMEYAWQRRSPDTVYFKPHKGQRVYVTISTNGGAITSFTPINQQLEATVRTEPNRLAYRKGRALVIPKD